MKNQKSDPTVSGEAKNATQDKTGIDNGEKHIYREVIDPREMTSIVNGNKVLFIGRGAREITLITDPPADEA